MHKIKNLRIKKALNRGILILMIPSFMIGYFGKISIESKKKTVIIETESKNCEDNNFQIFSHRALDGENSRTGIINSNNSNCCFGTEIDIRMTANSVNAYESYGDMNLFFEDNHTYESEELVIVHDNTIYNINRKTIEQIDSLKIDEVTYSMLKSLEVRPYNYKISLDYLQSFFDNETGDMIRKKINERNKNEDVIISLKEAIELLDISKTVIFDIKFEKDSYRNYLMMHKFYDDVKDYEGNFIVQAANPEALIDMKNQYPNFSYYLICKSESILDKYLNEFQGFNIKADIVKEDMIINLAQLNKEIAIWNLDSQANRNKIIDIVYKHGIASEIKFITDFPSIICFYLNEIEKNNENKVKVLF